jgi:hypothetical protein
MIFFAGRRLLILPQWRRKRLVKRIEVAVEEKREWMPG